MKDFLESALTVKADHIIVIVGVASLLAPFVISSLIFFPNFVSQLNPVTYLIIDVCLGFAIVVPSFMAVILSTRMDTGRSSDDQQRAAVPVTIFMISLISAVWLMLSILYFLFFMSCGLVPYVMMMCLMIYLVFPISIFFISKRI